MLDPVYNRYYTRTKNGFNVTKASKAIRRIPLDRIVVEPCCGDGGISNSLEDMGYTVISSDILPSPVATFQKDIFDNSIVELLPDEFDIVTNCPYQTYIEIPVYEDVLTASGYQSLVVDVKKKRDKHASDFIKRFMQLGPNRVIVLLRLSFQERCAGREELLDPSGYLGYKLKSIEVTPRISFTGDGKSDSSTTAWFEWVRGWEGEVTWSAMDPKE